MVTVQQLRVYRIECRRGGQRAYRGPVWTIAAPDGTVLVHTLTYPTNDQLEDAVYALNNA